MTNSALFAPWRMEYIRSLETPKDDGCFVCSAASAADEVQRRQRLVLWTTPHTVVLMNRYPYANGHLLVAPRTHKADPEEMTADEHLDVANQVTQAVRLLRHAVSAQGFNLGVNLGRCAGAGLPGHLHHHVVPRWGGDVNFMAVVGEARIIPQAISQLYEELVRVRGTLLP
jgi:ATP adenylyltransferase